MAATRSRLPSELFRADRAAESEKDSTWLESSFLALSGGFETAVSIETAHADGFLGRSTAQLLSDARRRLVQALAPAMRGVSKYSLSWLSSD